MADTIDWSVKVHDREMLAYWEGDRGFVFDHCAWGVDPPVLLVPPAAIWDESVPPWMRGRRDLVIQRLRERSGHVVRDDDSTPTDWRRNVLPK
jgi:hypothetical protein